MLILMSVNYIGLQVLFALIITKKNKSPQVDKDLQITHWIVTYVTEHFNPLTWGQGI